MPANFGRSRFLPFFGQRRRSSQPRNSGVCARAATNRSESQALHISPWLQEHWTGTLLHFERGHQQKSTFLFWRSERPRATRTTVRESPYVCQVSELRTLLKDDSIQEDGPTQSSETSESCEEGSREAPQRELRCLSLPLASSVSLASSSSTTPRPRLSHNYPRLSCVV